MAGGGQITRCSNLGKNQVCKCVKLLAQGVLRSMTEVYKPRSVLLRLIEVPFLMAAVLVMFVAFAIVTVWEDTR